ncbi:MAG: helix-turn-helix transcriptional regulator, partial [Lachnospiraceae bacterium]|nr:helix-turn-helix transcriptional regulator [Lachnospiraceae bacterium]
NTLLQQKIPRDPVIPHDKLHPDIIYAMEHLDPVENGATADMVHQAFLLIILARALPQLELMDRSDLQDDDLIYRTVRYIAEHFTENISLTSMAEDLYVSPYTLSRVFSNTFHRNFNRYLNESRLQYACTLLSQTDQTITEICMNTGFESQRTFNRVFQDIYHMSPRDYRKRAHNELVS